VPEPGAAVTATRPVGSPALVEPRRRGCDRPPHLHGRC
jgi:hypothetical protein